MRATGQAHQFRAARGQHRALLPQYSIQPHDGRWKADVPSADAQPMDEKEYKQQLDTWLPRSGQEAVDG